MKIAIWYVTLTLCASGIVAQEDKKPQPEAKDVAYSRTLNERATKIVAALDLAEAAKSNRVHSIIVQQYRDLNAIHESRDVQIKANKEKAGADKAAATAAIEAVRAETKPELDKLHSEFLTKLAAELSLEQVDKVKDGLTYGVAPLTYGVYLRMYPELTDEQKSQIKTWLHEARELAMDGSTSEEKHAVFGKYKGRINNYLSKAGYDAKKGEQNLKRATPPASDTRNK
jgi:fumarate hydratase class II